LVVGVTYKSHFKAKKSTIFSKKKVIFLKNVVLLLLFSKIFFKKCKMTTRFLTVRSCSTSLLKAPNRHKKFFHQVFYEYFFIKIFFKYKDVLHNACLLSCCLSFVQLDFGFFQKFGSNVLSKAKIKISFPITHCFFIV